MQRCSSSGLNFINVLRTAFTSTEPKSVKKGCQAVSLFTLLRSVRAKAVPKYVGEIDPWVNMQHCIEEKYCKQEKREIKKEEPFIHKIHFFGLLHYKVSFNYFFESLLFSVNNYLHFGGIDKRK